MALGPADCAAKIEHETLLKRVKEQSSLPVRMDPDTKIPFSPPPFSSPPPLLSRLKAALRTRVRQDFASGVLILCSSCDPVVTVRSYPCVCGSRAFFGCRKPIQCSGISQDDGDDR